jgi:2-dehydro-3-deoxyphosphogalactonate aldolase
MSADSGGQPSLIAILRGLQPERAVAVAEKLYDAGIRILEVPLNSPDPFTSISRLVGARSSDCLIGAGTVLSAGEVRQAHAAGARLIVAPNCDVDVITCALQLDMRVLPGIATATEAFTAIRAGTQQLKLFPAVTYGPQHLKALRAVIPPTTQIFPVGGIGASEVSAWLEAGAAGFGFGSELFRPEYTLDDIATRARRLVAALQSTRR